MRPYCRQQQTLESLKDVQTYFGENTVIPLLIHVKDEIRIQRALNRELNGKKDFDEMCRRWLADSVDFNKEKINSIHTFFIDNNNDIGSAINQAIETIKNNL
jgi:dephospho-CoA kinase